MVISLLSDPQLRKRLFDSGFFYGDLEHDFGYTSKTLKHLGFSDQEMRTGAYQERIHPQDVSTYDALWQRVNDGWVNELYAEYRVSDQEGRWHWIETHAVVLSRRDDSSIGQVIGTDRNISARKEAELVLEAKVRESLRQLKVTDAILKTGTLATENETLSRNLRAGIKQIEGIVAFERCDVYGIGSETEPQLILTVPDCNPDLEPPPRAFHEEVRSRAYPVIRDDVAHQASYRSAIGIPLIAHETHIGSVYLWHSEPGFYGATDVYPLMTVGTVFAVALYNYQAYRQSVRELETDELTGFLTRKSFNKRVRSMWHDQEYAGPRTVAMIDLDHFKHVNDTYGHTVGDSVIQNVAHVIRQTLRTDDILGRYGGEEFVVILPRTDTPAAWGTMERVRQLCQDIEMCDLTATVTVSIGLATTGADDYLQTMTEVIDRADHALYQAKRNGRNRVEIAQLQA